MVSLPSGVGNGSTIIVILLTGYLQLFIDYSPEFFQFLSEYLVFSTHNKNVCLLACLLLESEFMYNNPDYKKFVHVCMPSQRYIYKHIILNCFFRMLTVKADHLFLFDLQTVPGNSNLIAST